MWDLYADDESFQRIARGKGFHDAKLLAKVLYGKKGAEKEKEMEKKEIEVAERKKVRDVRFKENPGKFEIDPKLIADEEDSEDAIFVSRTKDYTFKPVKSVDEFVAAEESFGAETDVYLFDRSETSEFDVEREELKDELVAWNIRYQARLNKEST